ncbi:MAG: hypothetical protein GY787_09455 [Alteromonadales bacterium]|nr:hypothetical protein [Alteromonadales bacterium]
MKINSLGLYRDMDGNTYEIIETIKQLTHHQMKGSPTTHDGFRDFKTACGIPINLKNGVFFTWDNASLTPVP